MVHRSDEEKMSECLELARSAQIILDQALALLHGKVIPFEMVKMQLLWIVETLEDKPLTGVVDN